MSDGTAYGFIGEHHSENWTGKKIRSELDSFCDHEMF